jgi:hypothetical protein
VGSRCQGRSAPTGDPGCRHVERPGSTGSGARSREQRRGRRKGKDLTCGPSSSAGTRALVRGASVRNGAKGEQLGPAEQQGGSERAAEVHERLAGGVQWQGRSDVRGRSGLRGRAWRGSVGCVRYAGPARERKIGPRERGSDRVCWLPGVGRLVEWGAGLLRSVGRAGGEGAGVSWAGETRAAGPAYWAVRGKRKKGSGLGWVGNWVWVFFFSFPFFFFEQTQTI